LTISIVVIAARLTAGRLPLAWWMVIGLPTGTVNQIRGIPQNPCQISVSSSRQAGRGRNVQTQFIAMLKLLFKFYRS
jgi:hypothetical protein